MADWEEKVWGKTREVISSEFYSKHELQVIDGGYCSIHYHLKRANRFIITSGTIEVVEFYGPHFKRHLLGPDNTYDVPSLVPHMFIVHTNGSMIEEYYPDRGGIVETSDIIRLIEGGKLDSASDINGLPDKLLALIGGQNV